jgi:hypothetical protein
VKQNTNTNKKKNSTFLWAGELGRFKETSKQRIFAPFLIIVLKYLLTPSGVSDSNILISYPGFFISVQYSLPLFMFQVKIIVCTVYFLKLFANHTQKRLESYWRILKVFSLCWPCLLSSPSFSFIL